jgi:hypothetical protein
MHLLLVTMGAVSAIGMCALESNAPQTTLIYTSVVMNHSMFEETDGLKISVICLRVTQISVSSPKGYIIHARACVAPMCCRTTTSCHTHFGKRVD